MTPYLDSRNGKIQQLSSDYFEKYLWRHNVIKSIDFGQRHNLLLTKAMVSKFGKQDLRDINEIQTNLMATDDLIISRNVA